ncbi:MAG TPA: hypothetical protein VF195_09550 [Actinomycetota bacterium]
MRLMAAGRCHWRTPIPITYQTDLGKGYAQFEILALYFSDVKIVDVSGRRAD